MQHRLALLFFLPAPVAMHAPQRLLCPRHLQGYSKANKGSAEQKARKNVLVSQQQILAWPM